MLRWEAFTDETYNPHFSPLKTGLSSKVPHFTNPDQPSTSRIMESENQRGLGFMVPPASEQTHDTIALVTISVQMESFIGCLDAKS